MAHTYTVEPMDQPPYPLLLFPSCRSWASLLDLGSCSWWPPLSCSWPLRLYFAASASAVKVMTTLCPPREWCDAGAGPPPAGSVVPPPHPAVPLSLNISLALCAPLSFTVSRQDAVIQGLMSGRRPRPQVWSPPAWGRQGWRGWGASHRVGLCRLTEGGAVRSAPHPGDVLPVPLDRDPPMLPRGLSHAECSLSPPWLRAGSSSWLREVL